MHDGRWEIAPVDWRQVAEIRTALGISDVTARILVRRGLGDAQSAAAFLAAELPGHDPFLLGDMRAAVDRITAAIKDGTRIVVHGDYDVDGVCATAVAVLALRELGAEVEWVLPSRFEDGYGLSQATVERIAATGAGLIITVDCGITAHAEVERARELGIDVIVTDHHRPGDVLPDCPIVATHGSTYPCPNLAGTGVAYRLAEALLGSEHPLLTNLLDLVALATIADVVPLVDENRGLAAAGLRILARTSRPGLRALMRSAHVDPAAVDATAVSFRLAPRINAAGRLGRPHIALDLILCEDQREADGLARQLEELNRERQLVEDRITRDAVAQVEDWSPERRARHAYVVWGSDWHEGVIGIVASRLVERYGRPVVLIAESAEGWKGSGRSVPAFDLVAGLGACSEHLERFGGHRAAAGLSLQAAQLEAFATAFAAHADDALSPHDLEPVVRVDAVVPAAGLTLSLAQELDRLAPFGLGNPEPTLLVPGIEPHGAAAVGDGKHLRFRIRQHGRDGGSAIGFGLGSALPALLDGARFDLVFRLKENHWNGTVAPQLVVRRLFAATAAYEELRAEFAELWKAGEDAWTEEARQVFAELDLVGGGGPRQLLESAAFRALLAELEGAATAPLPLAA